MASTDNGIETKQLKTQDSFLYADIQAANEALDKEINRKDYRVENIVYLLNKINAMHARVANRTHHEIIENHTDYLYEISDKYVGTFRSRPVVWMLYGASFALQIAGAVGGLGLATKTFQMGAQGISALGTGLQGFSKFFEEEQNANRSIFDLAMQEQKRLRQGLDEQSSRERQEADSDVNGMKQADSQHHEAVTSILRQS